MLAILDPGRNVFRGGSVYSGCCTSFTSSLLRWSPHTTRLLLSLAWEGTNQTYVPTHSLHKSSESIQVLADTSVARELQAPTLEPLLSPCWQNPSTGSPWLGKSHRCSPRKDKSGEKLPRAYLQQDEADFTEMSRDTT